MLRASFRRSAAVTLLALACACGGLTGCGNPSEEPPVAEPVAEPGSGGTLRWMTTSLPGSLDPLTAREYPDEVVSAQIFEPLVSEVRGPQNTGGGRQPGLATLSSARGGTVWRIDLRPGVRFQDGSVFNAAAVVANFDRWLRLRAGQRLLPEIRDVSVRSPLRARVRLQRPEPGFAEALSSPRLAIISPLSFDTDSADSARVQFPESAGTGPFRLASWDGNNFALEANEQWWGNELGVGPALAGVVFTRETDDLARIDALEAGDVQVADGPFPRRITGDPLLVRRELANGQELGVERSVRGLSASQYPPQLTRVWQTNLGG